MAMTKIEEQAALVANQDVVVSLAKKYRSYDVDFDDLVQEGNIGFLKGMRNWSPEGGASLRTYAAQWAHVYIRRAVGTSTDGKMSPEERAASLDESSEEHKRTLHDVLPSSTFESPEEAYERNERIQMVRDAAASLDEREVTIVRGVLHGVSNEAIGQELGISRERVRQIKNSVLGPLAKRVQRAS